MYFKTSFALTLAFSPSLPVLLSPALALALRIALALKQQYNNTRDCLAAYYRLTRLTSSTLQGFDTMLKKSTLRDWLACFLSLEDDGLAGRGLAQWVFVTACRDAVRPALSSCTVGAQLCAVCRHLQEHTHVINTPRSLLQQLKSVSRLLFDTSSITKTPLGGSFGRLAPAEVQLREVVVVPCERREALTKAKFVRYAQEEYA